MITRSNERNPSFGLQIPPFAQTSWIGWFLFSLWGGIGLAALPIDLVLAYVYRPVPMDAREVAEYRLQVQKRVAELLDVGQPRRHRID